jgi:hypothetical protein
LTGADGIQKLQDQIAFMLRQRQLAYDALKVPAAQGCQLIPGDAPGSAFIGKYVDAYRAYLIGGDEISLRRVADSLANQQYQVLDRLPGRIPRKADDVVVADGPGESEDEALGVYQVWSQVEFFEDQIRRFQDGFWLYNVEVLKTHVAYLQTYGQEVDSDTEGLVAGIAIWNERNAEIQRRLPALLAAAQAAFAADGAVLAARQQAGYGGIPQARVDHPEVAYVVPLPGGPYAGCGSTPSPANGTYGLPPTDSSAAAASSGQSGAPSAANVSPSSGVAPTAPSPGSGGPGQVVGGGSAPGSAPGQPGPTNSGSFGGSLSPPSTGPQGSAAPSRRSLTFGANRAANDEGDSTPTPSPASASPGRAGETPGAAPNWNPPTLGQPHLDFLPDNDDLVNDDRYPDVVNAKIQRVAAATNLTNVLVPIYALAWAPVTGFQFRRPPDPPYQVAGAIDVTPMSRQPTGTGNSWLDSLINRPANPKARTIFVYGPRLPRDRAVDGSGSSHLSILAAGSVGNGSRIRYTLLELKSEAEPSNYGTSYHDAWKTGWETVTSEVPPEIASKIQAMDAMLVQADLSGELGGKDNGFKRFVIWRGDTRTEGFGSWFLNQGDLKASIQIVRPIFDDTQKPPANLVKTFEATDVVFQPERVRVEVRTALDPGLDAIPLIVGLTSLQGTAPNQKPMSRQVAFNGQSVLLARRTSDGPTIYRTDPILVYAHNDPVKLGAPGVNDLETVTGDRLWAKLQDDRLLDVEPLIAGALIQRSNESVWLNALKTAASSGHLSDAPTILDELNGPDTMSDDSVVDAICSSKLTNLDPRLTILVKLGHLAGMFVLRDTFVQMLRAHQGDVGEIAQSDGLLQALSGLAYNHRDDPNFAFGDIQVDGPAGTKLRGKIPLRRIYDDAWLRAEFGLNDADVATLVPGWRPKAFRQAFDWYQGALADALKTANSFDGSDVEAFLKFTGTGFDAVVSRADARLVKLTQPGGTELRWMPDVIAQKWTDEVSSLAIQVYANESIADVEKSLLLNTQAFFVGFGGSGPVGTIFLITLTGPMLVDALTDKLPTWLKSDQEVQFALSVAGVLGRERLDLAKLHQTSFWSWFVPAVLTGVFIGADVLQSLSALDPSAALVKSYQLLDAAERDGVAGIQSWSKAQEADLTAIIADAQLAKASGAALTDLQTRALQISNQLEQAAAEVSLAIVAAKPWVAQSRAMQQLIIQNAGLKKLAIQSAIQDALAATGKELADAQAALQAAKDAVKNGGSSAGVKAASDALQDVQLRVQTLVKLNSISGDASSAAMARVLPDDVAFLARSGQKLSVEQINRIESTTVNQYHDWHDAKAAFEQGSISQWEMYQFVRYRQQVVDDLLADVMRTVDPSGTKLKRFALGSINLTSDYDISVTGEGAERVVIEFNRRFRGLKNLNGEGLRYGGVESGVRFDTNVYTDPVYGLFPPGRAADGTTLDLTADPLQADEFRQFLFDQMKTRRYTDGNDALWTAHKDLMLKEATPDEKTVLDYVFGQVESGEAQARGAITARSQQIIANPNQAGPQLLGNNLETRAANDVYGDYLDYIDIVRTELTRLEKYKVGAPVPGAVNPKFLTRFNGMDNYQVALDQLAELSTRSGAEAELVLEDIKSGWRDLLTNRIRDRQGVALYFASEAYQTEGAFAHVVREVQAAKKPITLDTLLGSRTGTLSPDRYVDSFYENRADLFKELTHFYDPATDTFSDPIGAAGKTAKYTIRQLDAFHEAGGDLANLGLDAIANQIVAVDGARGTADQVRSLLGGDAGAEQFVRDALKASDTLATKIWKLSSVDRQATRIASAIRQK